MTRAVLLSAFICSLFLVSGCVRGRYTPPGKYQVTSTMEIAQPADVVQKRVLDYLASHAFAVKSVDRQSGIILAEGKSDHFEGVDCGSTRGNARMMAIEYEISINAMPIDDSTSRLAVVVSGSSAARHARKFLFIPTGRHTEEVSCVSTGRLEQQLFTVAGMQ